MRLTTLGWLVRLVSVLTLTPPLFYATQGEARAGSLSCTGDCNQDQQVRIDELVLLVSIALEASPPSRCPPLTEIPSIADLVRAVTHSLTQCPTPGNQPPPVPGATVLLNEIVFDPADAQAQLVELKIGTGGSTTDQLSLRNEAGDEYALPADAPQPAAGELLLIVFDGQARVASGVVHAGLSAFLNRQSGSVALVDENGAELDRVAWGADRFDSVPLGGGGVVGALAPGTASARRPHSTAPGQPQDWTVVAPPFATPGAPNYNPGVGQLHPQDGAVMDAGEIELSWFVVPGAASYRVQLATDATFSEALIDEVVARPPRTASLAPGRYFWRVQAIAEDNSVAEYSSTSELELVADLEDFAEQLVPAGPATRQTGTVFRLELTHRLPLYAQRKDTRMLLLESDQPTGTTQAWNAPHPGTDEMDPADRANCSLASTSMVNGFFASASDGQPNLSQDRIGLELYTKHMVLWNGPVFDLNYGMGPPYESWKVALEYALGAPVQMRLIGRPAVTQHANRGGYDPAFREQFWNELVASLARDRPVPFAVWTDPVDPNEHAMVARGLLQSGSLRYVWLNDPWHGRSYLTRLEQLLLTAYYLLPDEVNPASDEPDLKSAVDSDRDRIIDFDEEMRFGTNKLNRNTDDDCLGDFEEIELSVLDEQHGWGQFWGKYFRKMRPRSDGKARGDPRAWAPGVVPESKQPELTADADGGGLPDFVEDFNRNGNVERDRGESDPSDPSDDPREITGSLERIRDRDDPPSHFVRTSAFEHDLETAPDGRVTGTVRLTFNAMETIQAAAAPPRCPDPRVITEVWDEVTADLLVDGRWTCNPDPNHPGPNLILTEREPHTRVHQLITIMDPCLGTSRGDGGTNYTPYVGFALTGSAEEFSSGPGRLQWTFATSPDGLGDHAEWDITMLAPLLAGSAVRDAGR